MKNKTLLFRNFKFNPTDSISDDENFVISNMYNVTTENGAIESKVFQEDVLSCLFDETQIQTIKSNNSEIIDKIIRYIPYTYYDVGQDTFSNRLFVITNANALYELATETNLFELKYSFSTFPKIFEYENAVYLFDSNNKCIVLENNSAVSIEQIPTINSFISDNEKTYFLLKNKPFSFFTSELIGLRNLSIYPEQYTSIDSTVQDGQLYKIVNIKDKIFAISQYSILRFDEENNKFLRQNKIELEIYKDTIIALDNAVVFYTSNGLYLFDGSDIEQLTNNYLNFDKNANLVCFNQKIYILSQNYENYIFEYNFTNKYFTPIFLDKINLFYTVKTQEKYLLCASTISNNEYKNISIFNSLNWNNVEQKVIFKTTTFSSTNLKYIKNIFVKATGECKIKITSNLSSTELKINNSTAIYNVGISGTVFDFEIISSTKFKIDSILLNIEEASE